MSRNLSGKVALVTGASKGIGAEIARQLAQAGAKVIVNYASSREGADAVVKEITSSGGTAVAVQADVSQPDEIQRLFAAAAKHFGPVEILVNNAGIYQFAAIEEITPEHFHRQFDLNVLGLLLTTQAAVRQFPKSGGSVINISSVVATIAPPQSAVYSGTKGAVDTITRALANELGPRGIRVNSVNPGMVETEGARSLNIIGSDMHKQMEAITPLRRIGQPDDIAPVVVFLASDDAKWMTGETLYASGGIR